MSVVLESVLEIHPQVAVRPETFGALAYHYGNRRLIFLKHPDVQSTLNACGVTQDRWPSFIAALSSLETSEVVRERQIAS